MAVSGLDSNNREQMILARRAGTLRGNESLVDPRRGRARQVVDRVRKRSRDDVSRGGFTNLRSFLYSRAKSYKLPQALPFRTPIEFRADPRDELKRVMRRR